MKPGSYDVIPTWSVQVGDTETTGLSASDDRICSFWFQKLDWDEDAGFWKRGLEIKSLINPGCPIPEAAAKVNGFTWQPGGAHTIDGRINLYYAPRFEDIASELRGVLGNTPLVFHNSVFDAAFIDRELERAGEPKLDQLTICTKKAFSDIQGLGRPNHYIPGTNLNTLCKTLDIDTSGRFLNGQELHGAEVDGKLAVQAFEKLYNLSWLVAEDVSHLPHRNPSLSFPSP